jgi:signal peptidase I
MDGAHGISMKNRIRMMIGLLVLLVLIGAILALYSHAIRIFVVISGSMEPTLQIGDRILIDAKGLPDRFDVVALQDPEKPHDPKEQLVKRIIGIDGDVIKVEGGILYINGEEQYSTNVTANRIIVDDKRFKVPPGHIFVMGDNRNESYDSLDFGPVPVENLTGVLSYIIWPPKRWGSIPSFYQSAPPADSEVAAK